MAKTVHAAQNEKANTKTNTTTYFPWHGGLLEAEIDAQGQVQRRYVYLGLRPVAVIEYTGENRESTQLYAIQVDHLGTPQALTDAQQTVVWQARYNSCGRADVLAVVKQPRKPVPVGRREFHPTESLHEGIKIQ